MQVLLVQQLLICRCGDSADHCCMSKLQVRMRLGFLRERLVDHVVTVLDSAAGSNERAAPMGHWRAVFDKVTAAPCSMIASWTSPCCGSVCGGHAFMPRSSDLARK